MTINGEERDNYVEYVVVNYIGGGKCVRFVSGVSYSVRFRVFGSLLEGGYYVEVLDYNSLKE